LQARRAEFRAAGADVVLLGWGEPVQAAGFRVLSGWDGRLLADPTGAAYAALGLRRTSPLGLLRPALLREAWRARREGHRQKRLGGDPWQLGGTVVLAPGDRVLYVHRNTGPEDEAPLDDVLAALGPRPV
jgi:hypothetical protein